MDLFVSFKINKPRIIHEIIDDEVVIIDFDSGNYYSLDKAGVAVWGFIESGAPLREMVEGITNRYNGSRAIIEDAVRRLIDELHQEGLIVHNTGEEPESIPGLEEPVKSILEAGVAGFEEPILHRYTDMQDLLLLDPIHEVDEAGWPSVKSDIPDEDE